MRKGFPGLGPTVKGEKARVVVLGTGWAGSRLLKDLDTTGYDVVCVAPRNHMVFTPLLASTCVGTLEFRSVAEPVARIQPAVSKSPGSFFLLARCTGVNPDAHTVRSPDSGLVCVPRSYQAVFTFTHACVPGFSDKFPKCIYASLVRNCF